LTVKRGKDVVSKENKIVEQASIVGDNAAWLINYSAPIVYYFSPPPMYAVDDDGHVFNYSAPIVYLLAKLLVIIQLLATNLDKIWVMMMQKWTHLMVTWETLLLLQKLGGRNKLKWMKLCKQWESRERIHIHTVKGYIYWRSVGWRRWTSCWRRRWTSCWRRS
jgi:hypothetical protein